MDLEFSEFTAILEAVRVPSSVQQPGCGLGTERRNNIEGLFPRSSRKRQKERELSLLSVEDQSVDHRL